MHICVFEDDGVGGLEPLTLTRPAFDLRCGASMLLERQAHYFSAAERTLRITSSLIIVWLRSSLDGHALGEVARLVHVAAAKQGDVIGQELQRDDRDQRLEVVWHLGDVDHFVGTGRHGP